MRGCALIAFAMSAALGMTGLARADALVVNDSARAPIRITLPSDPWDSRIPNGRLDERPVGDLIALRLGIVNGRAELFRFRVEDAPSDKTLLRGVLDGGGLKLKITW
jgi:hypothetical protein